MTALIVICGFLGAWALVAGPVYQASIELRELAVDREAINTAAAAIPRPRPGSPWWWLLPPVAYLQQRAQRDAYQRQVMAALGREQREQVFVFFDKARGWLLVAVGAFFIALKETWELREYFEWTIGVFWGLVVAMSLLSLGYSVYQQHLYQALTASGD